MCFRDFFNHFVSDINKKSVQALDLHTLFSECTPAGNRTRIKGLGNLRSIHLTTGAKDSRYTLRYRREYFYEGMLAILVYLVILVILVRLAFLVILVVLVILAYLAYFFSSAFCAFLLMVR